MENIIQVNNLIFSYEDHHRVLDDISFEIKKGSYTTILGHNGSGKSTLAKLLLGLLEKDSGEIIIDGLPLNEKNIYQIRSKIGIVFQNPDNQFIGSTVRDDIAFGLENMCVPHDSMDEMIHLAAKKVSMLEYLDKEPGNLSGGQKQRVAIASILAMEPDIIIFDEATSMLDPKGKEDINQLISQLSKEQHTIISITHDEEEAIHSDEVIVFKKGKIIAQDSPEKIFNNESLLKDASLDTPFYLRLSSLLEKNGVHKTLNKDDLVNQLCQLKLKN